MMQEETWLYLFKSLIERIHSLDEAYRLVNKIPKAEPLPEDWDDLLKEPSTIEE